MESRVWYVGPVGLAGREVVLEVGGWFYVAHHYGAEAEQIQIVDLDGSEHPLNRGLVRNLYLFRKGQGVPFVGMYQGLAKGGSLHLMHDEMKFVAQLLAFIFKEEIADAATKEIPEEAKAA